MREAQRAIFRIRPRQMKNFMLRFSGNQKPDFGNIHPTILEDLIKVALLLDLVKRNGELSPTNRGLELIRSYEHNNEERERNILRDALEGNYDFRLYWAWACDKRDEFTTNGLVDVFRRLGFSEVSDDSLKLYIRAFVDWARSAGLCVKTGVQGYTYKILVRMTIGAKEGDKTSEPPASILIPKEVDNEDVARQSLFRLNSYVCDYLADKTHEGDLDMITTELKNLRGSEILDDLVIDMLEREIKTALETKSAIALAMVAQSLRSLRRRYIQGVGG